MSLVLPLRSLKSVLTKADMQDNNSIEIYLPKVSQPLIIDIDDIESFRLLPLTVVSWSYLNKYNRLYYSVRDKQVGKTVTTYLHRLIAGATDKYQYVDHINGNGMDNRKNNLRICTCSENQMNRSRQKTNKGKYKGVSFRKDTHKWKAQISIKNKMKDIGNCYCSEEEAARAYDEAAKKHYGEFAKLNFSN